MTKEPIVKFEAVHQYNQLMGALDRSDQMVSYNAFKRRTLKWWKKVFFHLFMLGVLNAYLVHKVTAVKKLSHRIFRRDLAKQLAQLAPLIARPPLAVRVRQSFLFRMTARHFAKKKKLNLSLEPKKKTPTPTERVCRLLRANEEEVFST